MTTETQQPAVGAQVDLPVGPCQYNGGTCARRGCIAGCQASHLCQPNGLKFDALGEPRTRYVRVSLEGNHCVMRPSEGDRYLADARANDDNSPYVVADVWLSEREFDDLPEHEGF